VRNRVLIVMCAVAATMVLWSGARACPCTAVATPETATVCKNESVYFNGSGSRPVHVKCEWDFDGGTLEDPEKTTEDMIPGNVTWDEVGVKTVTLSVIDDDDLVWDFADDTSTVNVIELDRLQYNEMGNGYVDATGTLNVVLGTTVEFKAVPNPATVPWPSGKLVWRGTSGASGTGETQV
jgi:hypothetical protein